MKQKQYKDAKQRWKKRHPYRAKASMLMAAAKRRADKKGMDYNLELDWIVSKLKKGCELSGLSFDMNPGGITTPYSPSLDRRDRRLGYTKENTQVILFGINAMKNTGTNTDVFLIAAAIRRYRLRDI